MKNIENFNESKSFTLLGHEWISLRHPGRNFFSMIFMRNIHASDTIKLSFLKSVDIRVMFIWATEINF